MGEAQTSSDREPPSVCFVSRKWPPAMGGIETYAVELSTALEAYARLERIVLPGRSDGSAPGPLALLWFGLCTGLRLAFARRPADVTHVADMASWPHALIAGLRAPRNAVVLSAHGTDVSYADNPGLRGRAYRAYLKLGARLLPRAQVIANSRATAALLETHGFRGIVTVRLATALSRPNPPPDPTRALLFAGRLVPRKGLSWFVREVLPRLPEDITLDVAGTIWDAREAHALSSPRVRHLGSLPQERLAEAYASALAVIVPNVDVPESGFEGFGLVAAEASAAGGMVLAANRDGLPDAVEDGVTGRLLPSGDVDAWGAAISEVAKLSVQKRAEYIARSSARAIEVFSWDRVARETLATYRAAALLSRNR